MRNRDCPATVCCTAKSDTCHTRPLLDEDQQGLIDMTFKTTIAAPPRIGAQRELKFALENYWSGNLSENGLYSCIHTINAHYAHRCLNAGLESIPTIGTSFYDSILDLSATFGLLPERTDGLTGLEALFVTARGNSAIPASPMTKWFDTNYHYIVPELAERLAHNTLEFTVDPHIFIEGITNLINHTIEASRIRPVIIGPATYLYLSDLDAQDITTELLDRAFAAYATLITAIKETGVEYIQIDEPIFSVDFLEENEHLRAHIIQSYTQLAAEFSGLIIGSYFGSGQLLVESLDSAGLAGLAIDLSKDEYAFEAHTQTPLILGLIDGRNIWKADYAVAKTRARGLEAPQIAFSTSCSLLHVPYDLNAEEGNESISEELFTRLAFGYQKIKEVVDLAEQWDSIEINTQNTAQVEAEEPGSSERLSFEERKKLAPALPFLPTTTIGSFPQTADIRRARASYKAGTLSYDHYIRLMEQEIERTIAIQEEIGLDVLVHGEPERNDMVQYFAELLHGCATTHNGWVQSYGSRCVRPPIIYSDVYSTAPLTVEWYKKAQSFTNKPVKGMLTGPITILAWSFVREDQPLVNTANQIARAIATEIAELEKAGATHIQVDEPAIRELLPLKKAEQEYYLAWATGAFLLATGKAKPQTVIHTHMCYSAFEDILSTIQAFDADVTTIEAARSQGKITHALAGNYEAGVGPGVWDIHSPRVPEVGEIEKDLENIVKAVPLAWANPDCGLKTRNWEETKESLTNLVQAVQRVRTNSGVSGYLSHE